MKDESTRLWESLTNIVKAAQKRSDKFHDLKVKTVVRTAGASHPDSEDAKQCTNEELMAMADRIKLSNQKHEEEQAALAEELDQSVSKSAASSPRTKVHQESEAVADPAAQPKAPACPPQEEQPGSKMQKATMVQTLCPSIGSTDLHQNLPAAGRSAEFPDPKGPPKQQGLPEDSKEKEGGDQRPEAAKKAKPMAPPGEMRTNAKTDWLKMPAHERMGLPEEEDITVIHISALPLAEQVPKTFDCTKKNANRTVYIVTVKS